jgi:hypothetical protein
MKRSAPSPDLFRLFNILAPFLFCSSAAVFALHKLRYPLTGIDDANIYFVYARNLAHGFGFVYNIGGERVEGFTSLLWTLISALAFKFTASPEIGLLIVNILLVSLGISYALAYIQGTSGSWQAGLFWSVLFLGLLFTSPRYVVWNTITLMENALWSTLLLLTTVFVIRDHSSPRAINAGFLPLALLLLLTRPESFVWVAVFLAVLFLRLAFTGGIRYAFRSLAPSLFGILLGLIILTLFRLQYFGYPLPNTYYAKVSPSLAYNLEQGTLYLIRYMISDPIISVSVLALLLACVYSSLRVSPAKGDFYLPFIAAAGLLIPILTGGDHFGSFRFYQNVYPVTLLCLIHFVRAFLPNLLGPLQFPQNTSKATLVLPVSALLFCGLALSQNKAWSKFPPEIQGEFDIATYERSMGAFLQDLFSSLPRFPSVGVIAAGGIKYSYGGEIVDLVGLNNTVMAHNHGNRMGYKGHAAFEIETFYRLQPEIVLPFMVNDTWHYSEKELHNRWENRLAFKGLFDQPRFLESYEYAKVCKISPAECKTAVVGWFQKEFLKSVIASGQFSVEEYEYAP